MILSEAGSGKTIEIRHIAQQLRRERRPAFFLRLEHIGEDFESAFEEGSYEEFQTWLNGADEAWLLLDSIDEARLRNPLDFATAIRILGRRLGAAKQRVHIVLSGRSTAWRPKSDLSLCLEHLPYLAVETKDVKVDEDQDAIRQVDESETSKENPIFNVVALDDLSSRQIEVFAKAKSARDTKALLEAVERAEAWSFTARPQDLEELVTFWNDRGRIGSRLELMTNSIQRRLEERNQEHAEARPLSVEKTRSGARLVAAVCTLSRENAVRVPDGLDNGKGLPIRSILPDWNDVGCATLLSRPIFDEAIYGAVRFHHRTVREYLTAEWCAELLRQKTSRKRIEALFFRRQYDIEILVPSMRQVLAWLVLLDDGIRERTQQVAPEVFFEGGDPSHLPLPVRRQILERVCESVAAGTTRSVPDYSAVQRFAANDLADDVVRLINTYSGNEEILEFILRMVWKGQMTGASSEAKAIAQSPTAGKYVRRAAFRALTAIAEPARLGEVRSSFLKEESPLNRELLEELLSSTEPTVGSIDWLFSCIDKVGAPRRHNSDNLSAEATNFVERMAPSLLSAFVQMADKRLDQAPVIERRHCEISQRNAWLLLPAGAAVHRLVQDRDPSVFTSACLNLLHKLPLGEQFNRFEFRDTGFEFHKLISGWAELKFALFWHLIAYERRWLDRQKGERLRVWWNSSVFDSFARSFEAEDFPAALQAVMERCLDDDKEVALTLAFALYVRGGRPASWRRLLHRAVVGDAALQSRLASMMRPAPLSTSARNSQRTHAAWERRHKARRAQKEENDKKWRAAMRAKPDGVRNPKLTEADAVGNWQWGLHERMSDIRSGTKLSVGNWASLTAEFGDEVARAFRDGAVAYWRRHRPKLPSEGGSQQTRIESMFGLTGLAIEARETENWPGALNQTDAEIAFRYAMEEMNGFPDWMPALFKEFPALVLKMMLVEVDYELATETVDRDSHYVLDDVSWSGDWLWNLIGPEYLARLLKREPKNLRNLGHMLNVIHRASTISDDAIAGIASVKCEMSLDGGQSAIWYASWVGTAPEVAIPQLQAHLAATDSSESQTAFAMKFVTNLMGAGSRNTSQVREKFQTPTHLKDLYLLMHRYIREADDIDRANTGVYSPGLRDDAQDGRDRLFVVLRDLPGKEAYIAMRAIAEKWPKRPWLAEQAKGKAEADSEGGAWTAMQVCDFTAKLERIPSNHRDLFDLAVMRFEDLKADLEHGDSSSAGVLRSVSDELEMRKYIGGLFRSDANGRYTIPQEEELADSKRIDLRFHGVGFDGPVPVELKLADNWPGPSLFERFETQLCGDYLRDVRSKRGLFVLVYRGKKKKWELPNGNDEVDFSSLVAALQAYWIEISTQFGNVEEVRVIGIDLTMRDRRT